VGIGYNMYKYNSILEHTWHIRGTSSPGMGVMCPACWTAGCKHLLEG
jgi:hypothetical protein